MPSKPTDIDAMKIEISKDGTATLTGINYGDLRSILTAASLHYHESRFKPKPATGDLADVIHQNNIDSARWYLDQRLLVDTLHAYMAEAIRPGYSDGLPAIDSAKARHRTCLDALEEDVRKAEVEAATQSSEQKLDPLDQAAAALRTMIRQADGVLAQMERARASRTD